MIQDIYPDKLHNEYAPCEASGRDTAMVFDDSGKVLLGEKDGGIVFPQVSDMASMAGTSTAWEPVYLFSLNEERFFLFPEQAQLDRDGYSYYTIREARDRFAEAEKNIFAVFTAYHLWRWYADNRHCGRCGAVLEHSRSERALTCPACGNVIYPRINPAVIVGVIKGDCLLLTQYRRGYRHNALVAGFTEIGETLEETVAREVMEETGVKVKKITYYKSQPWGMEQDILVGYYCEADGDSQIRMDENELAVAAWVRRDEIVLQPNNLSLTNEMMKKFKEGKITAEDLK